MIPRRGSFLHNLKVNHGKRPDDTQNSMARGENSARFARPCERAREPSRFEIQLPLQTSGLASGAHQLPDMTTIVSSLIVSS